MDRFWSKVNKGDGCWEWRAARFQSRGKPSYGMFRTDRLEYAHRVAWRLTNGEIPVGVLVLHHCDNRRCVRPDHLYLGSHADNMRDAVERQRMARGEDIAAHRLTEDKVRAIRAVIDAGVATEAIGVQFGVSGRTVRYIRSGKRWAHVK